MNSIVGDYRMSATDSVVSVRAGHAAVVLCYTVPNRYVAVHLLATWSDNERTESNIDDGSAGSRLETEFISS